MLHLFIALAALMAPKSYALSSREVKLLAEKTYSRDNTFCKFKNKTIEIEIRGDSRYSERKETYYGQYIFQVSNGDFSLLPVNTERFGRYRFMRGRSPLCTKSIGVTLDDKTAAVLFLKENRPFKEKLVIQLFDASSATAKEVIETDYLTDKVELTKDGFNFRTITERFDRKIGKVSIAGHDYIYQDQDMTPWISYTSKGFEILPNMTFQKSEFKKFFRDETDFFMFSGWNSGDKKFSNPYVYTAINHELKRECVLFSSIPKASLSGNEFWRCKDK